MVRLLLATLVLTQLTGSSAPRWMGTWRGPNGSLIISRDTKQLDMAMVEALIATPQGCRGEALGKIPMAQLGRVQAAVKVGHRDDNQELCTMSLTLVDEGTAITLKQEGACADLHGATCDFRGRYVRQQPARRPSARARYSSRSAVTTSSRDARRAGR